MQIGKSEGTWVEVIDWGVFKSFRKRFWIGRYRNTFWTGQFESFTFLGCVQTDATTPNLWCIVGRIQPIGLCKPCVISVRRPNNVGPFAWVFQHCWDHAPSLRMVYKDLWVVSFPRCTAGANIVGSCCIRLHTTANTHATTPTLLAQQCWDLLRPFARSLTHCDWNTVYFCHKYSVIVSQ